MPRNGSGVYSLPAGNPVVTGTIISSSWANTTLNDIASALTQSQAADGQTPITGDVDYNTFIITNLGDGIAGDDAANISQIQNNDFNWCGTAGGTANALTLSPAPAITAYAAGQFFTFKAASSNTLAVTVAVSGLATKAIQSQAAALVADDIVANQWYRATYDGAAFQLEQLALGAASGGQTFTDITVTDTATFEGVSTFEADAIVGGNSLLNSLARAGIVGTITAAAAANAITISLKSLDGGDPSATEPVKVTLRDATITSGALTTYSVTSALSTVISSGSTLGCGSSEVVRIHIGAMLNASTGIELFYWTGAVAASTSIKRFDPAAVISTTAEGGAGGADTAQTAYSTTARTSQPWVYLGYIEATSGATAGQWASIGKIVNWQTGVPLPGDLVACVWTRDSAYATGTTAVPVDDTIPQITEGDQYMTLAVTPKSVMNRLHISHQGCYACGSVGVDVATIALFQDATANALASMMARTLYEGNPAPSGYGIYHEMRAGTVSATTFRIRVGGATNRGIVFNGYTAAIMGGTLNSYVKIEEYHT